MLLARLVLVLALGFGAAFAFVAGAFLGALALVAVFVAVFLGAPTFFGAAVFVFVVVVFCCDPYVSSHLEFIVGGKRTLAAAAAGFLAGFSVFGAAASFFMSLTVPEGPRGNK